MNIEQAFQILVSASEQAVMNKAAHVHTELATNLLRETLFPPAVTGLKEVETNKKTGDKCSKEGAVF